MPILFSKIKKELQDDRQKVGKLPSGDYKHEPPNIVGRLIRLYPKLKVSKIVTNAMIGTKVISFTCTVKSETSAGVAYKVTVKFHDVEFREAETAQFKNKVKIKVKGKYKTYYYRTPSLAKNEMTMKCQCSDFRHRFETPLAKAGGLIGGPRSYTRKTKPWPQGRPSANSTKKLGFCKHVSSFLYVLKDKNMIKER